MASIVPSSATLAARYSDRIRNGTSTASSSTRPPIVGVPALPAWPAGPSSRMCWPNSLTRRNSMNRGPRNMQMSREPTPPIRISPSMGQARTLSRPTEREPFTSTRSPGRASSSSSAPASSGVSTG